MMDGQLTDGRQTGINTCDDEWVVNNSMEDGRAINNACNVG